MVKTFKTLAAAIALGVCATAASATSVTFDFSGPGATTTGSLSWTDAGTGLSVTATAHEELSNGDFGTQVRLGWWSTGLGVFSTDRRDSHQIDSSGTDELVRLAFSGAVSLTSATFSYWSSSDDFSLGTYDDGGSVLSYALTNFATCDVASCSNTSGSLATSGSLTGFGTHSIFALGASGGGDAFKLKSLTVEYVGAEVPLPAAGWLLLGAIGGLGVLRRRKG